MRSGLRQLARNDEELESRLDAMLKAINDVKQQAEKATSKAGSALAEATKRTTSHELLEQRDTVELLQMVTDDMRAELNGVREAQKQLAARIDGMLSGLGTAIDADRRVKEKQRVEGDRPT